MEKDNVELRVGHVGRCQFTLDHILQRLRGAYKRQHTLAATFLPHLPIPPFPQPFFSLAPRVPLLAQFAAPAQVWNWHKPAVS